MSYEVGSKVRSTVAVTDLAGPPTDATMSIAVTKPDGTTMAPPAIVDAPGTGNYYADITVDQPGVWTVVWSASVIVVAVYTNQFSVRPPGPRIISLAEAKAHLNKDPLITTDDDELRAFIDAAQVVIEGVVGPVVPIAVTEWHHGGHATIVLNKRPVFSVTSVKEWAGGVGTTIIAEAGAGTDLDYVLQPRSGILTRRGFLSSRVWGGGWNAVEVNYLAGRNPIGGNITLAAKEEVAHLWRNSQLARGSARQNAGAEDVLTQALAFSLPHRIADLLSKSKRAPMQGG